MEYSELDDNMERHWRMVFENNDGGVYYKNAIIHANRRDV